MSTSSQQGVRMETPAPGDNSRTIHINYNHSCPKCKAMYVPFGEDVPCPRCGMVETKRFDFVTRAAESAQLNLATNGSYLPHTWWVSSLADFVLYVCFEILEQHRKDGGIYHIDQVAKEVVEGTDMADKPYLREHVYEASLAVYDRLNSVEE